MGKYFQSQAAPKADPQIWSHTKQMEDGLGGGSLVATGLVAGSTLKKGALIYWDGAGATRNVYPVKNALVVTGGTTTAPRVQKNHLFKVGEFGFVSGDAVTINSIDTSNAAYDVITFSAACTGAAAGAYIEQANAAGGAVAGVKGVYTMTIGTKPAAGDKFSLDGVVYEYAAAEGAGVYAIGSDAKQAAANVEDAVSAQYEGVFSVVANNGKLIFTQLVGGTGAQPVLVVTQYPSTGTLAATMAETVEGVAAVSVAPKYVANAILGESIYDVQGGEPCTVVLWIFQAIEKSRLPYAASSLRLADLSNLKFV